MSREEAPHAPSYPLNLRPATLKDVEAIADLINACSSGRTVDPTSIVQNVRCSMQMPGLNLERDTLLAIGPEGKLVAYALLQDNPPSPVLFALADVHPRFMERGIGGGNLAQWIEERARRSIPERPAGDRIALLQQRPSTDVAARELLLGQGYQLVRHNFRMAIEFDDSPPQPTLPEGIIIRPFIRDEEGRALIHALREAFRDNWGYAERPFELDYQRWMHLLDRDPDHDASPFWFVAVDGGEIAGFCLCRPRGAEGADRASVYIVGVRPAWRRRGIALALLQQSFCALYEAGKRQVSLEVDAQNPTGATRLYEKAGMHVQSRSDFFEKVLRTGPESRSA